MNPRFRHCRGVVVVAVFIAVALSGALFAGSSGFAVGVVGQSTQERLGLLKASALAGGAVNKALSLQWLQRSRCHPGRCGAPAAHGGEDAATWRARQAQQRGFSVLGFSSLAAMALSPWMLRRSFGRSCPRRWRSAAAAAATEGNAAPAANAAPWAGVKVKPFAICVALGLAIRFLVPTPAGVTSQAWSMLSLFVATIAGIVTGPLPPPGVALCSLTVGILTGTLTFAQGMTAFTDEVIWLVVLAFFFARGFSKTGLGDRIAFNVVRAVGGTTLGLAYGLNAAEAVVAAGMPSSAARAAGIFYPITTSVAKASGSDPALGTQKKTGRFLVQSAFQATGNSSSLFLTGAAQNMLVLRLASQLGYEISNPFKTWLVATSVPALAAMVLTPLLAFKLLPPEAKKTPEAPEAARKKLEEMGPMSRDEIVMGCTMLGMVALWAGSSSFGIPPVVTALMGLCTLLLFGTVTWADCVNEKGAWTTFTWFSILVSMSAMLNKLGIVKWLAGAVSSKITGLGLAAGPAFVTLTLLYTAAHYLFASQVAQVGALYQPFVAMMVQTGTPPTVAVLSLAVVSNLFASLTPYASAQAPVFYGGGYVTQGEWYKAGLIFMLFNLLVWGMVGTVWWRALGLL